MIGNMSTKAKRSGDAIAAYQRALTLDPDNQTAVFNLAMAYKTAGRLEAAEAGFERTLALNARDPKARYQLADMWMTRGEFAIRISIVSATPLRVMPKRIWSAVRNLEYASSALKCTASSGTTEYDSRKKRYL